MNGKSVTEVEGHLMVTAHDGVLQTPDTDEIRAILDAWVKDPETGIDELSATLRTSILWGSP